MSEPLRYRMLACPRCRGALQEGWRCSACDRRYPTIGGIPVLLEDAERRIAGWGAEALTLIDNARHHARHAADALEVVSGRRRQRLDRAQHAWSAHADIVEGLFRDAGVPLQALPSEAIPAGPGLVEHYTNIHRDWGWDNDENQQSLQLVAASIGAARPRRLLVLGAGASRLAYDLHRAVGAELTVAVDLNPLPLLIAQRLLRGEGLDLYEFPVDPIDAEHASVRRPLRAPVAEPNVQLVLADGTGPLAAQPFDAVVTPWFVDQVPSDLALLLRHIRRALCPGGLWVHFGPLIYPRTRPLAVRLTAEEIAELAQLEGFEVEVSRRDVIPYLASPIAYHGRRETVLTIVARKLAAERHEAASSWLEDASAPVWLAGVEALQLDHPVMREVAARIDGRRSTRQIADELVVSFGLPRETALHGVRLILRQLRSQLAVSAA